MNHCPRLLLKAWSNSFATSIDICKPLFYIVLKAALSFAKVRKAMGFPPNWNLIHYVDIWPQFKQIFY
jgi:hypothetical protein